MNLFKRLFGKGKKNQSFQDWCLENHLQPTPMLTVKEPKSFKELMSEHYPKPKKPHIWYSKVLKKWLCSGEISNVLTKGIGYTPKQAYENYKKSAKWNLL